MYITIYSCNTEKPAVCRALMDAAEMHRQVQYLFNSAREDYKVLYRLDQGYLLVQSDIKPICDGIFEYKAQYDMTDKLANLSREKQFRFRIKAIPRVSVHGKKHYIHDEEKRIEWLKKQFKKNGMNLLAVRESGKENLTVSSKVNVKTGGSVKLSTWDYEGVFGVEDKDAFINGCEKGIGSQKAYGCGMICLCG